MLRFRRRAVMAVIPGALLAATACDPLPPPPDEIKLIYPTYTDGSPVHKPDMLNDRGEFTMVDPASRWSNRDSIWSDGEVFNLGSDDVNAGPIRDISNRGHVVGQRLDVSSLPPWEDGERPCHTPYLWIDGEWTDLPLGDNGIAGDAHAVNDHGDAAGYIVSRDDEDETENEDPCTGEVLPVVWKDGKIIRPPADSILADTRSTVSVQSITNGSHVVVRDSTSEVVIWKIGGEVVELNIDGGNESVLAVNERGMILLNMYAEGRAFLWHDGELSEITNSDDPSPAAIQAYDLNVWGQVVGTSIDAEGERRSFIWYQGEMRWLETLGGSGPYPNPVAINNWGQVVGNSYNAEGDRRAFLWQNGRIIDLDELIDDPDIFRTIPVDINNNGQILARTPAADDRAVMWEVAPLWPGYPDGL